jgi:hypothetical protein
MKKALTLLFLAGLSTTLFAQKTLDMSLDKITSPTELQSDPQTGTKLPIKLVCKNNGTDDLAIGDTLYWNALLIDIAQSQILVEAPQGASQGNSYLTVLTRAVPSGDTITLGNSLNINLYLSFSRAIRFGASCGAINRASPVVDGNTGNNSTFVDITWFNTDRNGVSVEKLNYNNNIAVFPNPASTELNVQLLLTQYADVVVELLDLTGKVILSENVSSSLTNNGYTVDVSSIPTGLYIVRVSNGEQVNTSKVSIAH